MNSNSLFSMPNTLRRSITKLCAADHQNDPAEIEGWLSNNALPGSE
ncbi:acetyltransferase, gnat family [Citreicella sp. SE45]|nr:acetyltransferase, gnat family [Citreicella sp. SE45]